MSCRKLAGEPSERLSWQKRWFYLMLCKEKSLEKIHGVIFSRDWVREKKGRPVQILGLRSEGLTELGCSLLPDAQPKPEALCSDWVVAEGRVSRTGLRGPGGGFPGQWSWPVAWRRSHTGTFWMTGRSSCPQKKKNGDFSSRQYSGMHSSGSQQSYLTENVAKQFNTEGL